MGSLGSDSTTISVGANVQIQITSDETAVYCFSKRALPGYWGQLILQVSDEIDKFEPIISEIDEFYGELTPEQVRYRESLLNSPHFEESEFEYTLEHENYIASATFIVDLFVRAFPVICFYNIQLNPFYDGFYGPFPGASLDPVKFAVRGPRQFVKSVFGEYRRSFVRELLNKEGSHVEGVVLLAKALKDPDLIQRGLGSEIPPNILETSAYNDEVIPVDIIDEFSEFLTPNSRLKLLLDSSPETFNRYRDIFRLIDRTNLKPLKAKNWEALLSKLVKIPLAESVNFPEWPTRNKLESIEVKGYTLKQVLCTEELISLSIDSDNCVSQVDHNINAENGVGYFRILLEGKTIGTTSIEPLDDGEYAITALGVANKELEYGTELESRLHSLLTNKESR